MKYVVKDNYQEVSSYAFSIYKSFIKEHPSAVLGMATGSTPLGLYELLVKAYKANELDFSQITTFNLDEYIGLDASNPNSYNSFMWQNLFSHINIRPENVNIPPGKAEDLKKACQEYDKKIAAYGNVDLMLLGVGENGHIAFNEPKPQLAANTHIIDLSPDTIAVNARFFETAEEVPHQAITMGMAQILKSKQIVLIATGPKKAEAMAKLIKEETISCMFPVSFLRTHPNTIVILDKEAASLI